jgi:hypothetical protein
MKNINKYLLVISSAIILFFLSYFPNKITKLEQNQKLLYDITSDGQTKLKLFEFNFEIGNKMTGLKAPDICCLEYRNEPKQLAMIVKKQPLLVLRYSDINCSTCYEDALDEMNEIYKDSTQLVIVLCSYINERDFFTFKRINRIKYILYKIPSDAFKWPVEEYNTPYFFVLHPDMKISHIYIPNKSFPEMNKAYLEGVKKFLVN